MTKPTFNLSFRDRNLIRLSRSERLENFYAQILAENGDVELFEMERDLDTEGFPYPFAKVGKHKIHSLEITDQGRERIDTLIDINRTNFEAYSEVCQVHDSSGRVHQLLYTAQGVAEYLNFGERDKLVVFNKRKDKLSHPELIIRTVDPDTGERIVPEEDLWEIHKEGPEVIARY